MSSWVFGCWMGLKQTDCGEYEADPESRGHERLGGCCSCVHRKPANQETKEAEDYYARHQAIKDLA